MKRVKENARVVLLVMATPDVVFYRQRKLYIIFRSYHVMAILLRHHHMDGA